MPITWEDTRPQTATTSPGGISETLGNMLPVPERPPPQDTPLTQFEGMTSPDPWDPYGSDTGTQVIQRGLPMAGGMLGASMGPVGAGLGSATGELAGQVVTGQSPDWMRVGASGVLGAAGNVAGRVLAGTSRVAENALRSSPTAQALGVRAPYATASSPDIVPLTSLKTTVDDLASNWQAVVPVGSRPVPTQANKLVNELGQLQQILQSPNRPLNEVATLRRLIGTFIEGNKTLPEARALYGSLMSDLRAAAPTSPAAEAYLHDLANDRVVRALIPENMLERMLLYGSGAAMGFGGFGASAAIPAGLVLGGRAFSATPRSVADVFGAGAATLANPYRRE